VRAGEAGGQLGGRAAGRSERGAAGGRRRGRGTSGNVDAVIMHSGALAATASWRPATPWQGGMAPAARTREEREGGRGGRALGVCP